MTNQAKLRLIRILHTMIWVFYNVVIFYMLYAVIIGKIDLWLWICIGLVLVEGMILLIFKNICPVTLLAGKYSASTKDNFDIFLPNWLARYNKLIYTTLFIISIAIWVYQLLTG